MPGRFPGPCGGSAAPAALDAGTLSRTLCFAPGPLPAANVSRVPPGLKTDRFAGEPDDTVAAAEFEPPVRFKPPDTARYKYDMINDPGPLAQTIGNARVPPAANFSAGKYNETVLKQPTVLFRVQPKALVKIDGQGRYDWNPRSRVGGWFSPEPPQSAALARIDSALPDHWIDPRDASYLGSSSAETLLAVRLPAGVKVYYGPISGQGSVHVGGANKIQVFVPDIAAIAGIRILAEESLAPATMQGVADALKRYR